MRVLVVCSGNICRSPTAEAVLRSGLDQRGLDHIHVESAGTLGIEGEPADLSTRQVALEAGYDLENHRSRGLTREMATGADLILAMEDRHRLAAEKLCRGRTEVRLLGAHLPEPVRRRQGDLIEDPVGAPLDEHRACLVRIEAAVEGVIRRLEDEFAEEDGTAAEEHYFGTLEEKVRQARGIASSLSSMEFHIVDRWWRSGTPLWRALKAVESAASRYPDGEAPAALLRAAEKDLAPDPATPPALPSTPARGSAHEAEGAFLRSMVKGMREALDRIPEAHRELHEAVRESLKEIDAASVASSFPDPDLLERCEDRIAAAAGRAVGEVELAALADLERDRLTHLAARMSDSAVEETLRRLTRDRLLARFGIPRLSR